MRYACVFVAPAIVIGACGGSDEAADAARFCTLVDEINAQDTTAMPLDKALPVIEQGRDKMEAAIKMAPTEISADADTVFSVAILVTDVLIHAGTDPSQVNEAALTAIIDDTDQAKFSAADGRLEQWTNTNCSYARSRASRAR